MCKDHDTLQIRDFETDEMGEALFTNRFYKGNYKPIAGLLQEDIGNQF